MADKMPESLLFELSEKNKMKREKERDPRRNAEGYLDLTAYHALKHVEEEERFKKLLRTIFALCELAGFEIEGRIVLVDKKTGRVWR